MKYCMWMIAILGWAAGDGSAAAMATSYDQMEMRQNYVQVAPMSNRLDQTWSMSIEGKAEVRQNEVIDRLTELKAHDSDLEMRTFELNQENLDMLSQLEQNRLELKQLRNDLKAVQKNIRKLKREQVLIGKRDLLRK